ncbi:hypothetical protein AS850_02685 [Frondihabitans sp. 762G35]|uniref:hypothetical protein n=1 Tax=Frondihabitans sp. 762G35 TaxID=1446794 RepID=UPI000D206238|nr:hypothetical protein [Frondihabitans sp. 762G35]ARC55979.1 hypothetical protein AS850_02685 [Frondihabitans sp. 762G35]
MDAILYSDILAAVISRLTTLIRDRDETFAQDVTVSDKKASGADRSIVLSIGPGGSTTNTIRRSFVTVDVYANSQTDSVDLMNLALALATSRGADGMVNGSPLTYAAINGGPNADFASDDQFKQTAELDIGHRGTNLPSPAN